MKHVYHTKKTRRQCFSNIREFAKTYAKVANIVVDMISLNFLSLNAQILRYNSIHHLKQHLLHSEFALYLMRNCSAR